MSASKEFLDDWYRWHKDGREPGKNAHWCFDWDFLPIDDQDDEYESCNCYER